MRTVTRRITGALGEFSRIEWLTRLFSKQGVPKSIALGIGDDAAAVRSGRNYWVWTVDACVEDVHFRHAWLTPQDLGWRSFHAAVSDLAAMGAEPVAALSSIAMPKHCEVATFQGVARGQAAAARTLNCPIIGGNLTGAREFSIHTTALGVTACPLRRGGARAGDELWLLGNVGAAAAGLKVLSEVPERKRSPDMRWCTRIWRRPTALIAHGVTLRNAAHAAIDVSDGLVADLQHMTDASHLRAVLDLPLLEATLAPQLRRTAQQLEQNALNWALFGGEDYALLAAGPARKRPVQAKRIGGFERGRGVWSLQGTRLRRLSAAGFDHFD